MALYEVWSKLQEELLVVYDIPQNTSIYRYNVLDAKWYWVSTKCPVRYETADVVATHYCGKTEHWTDEEIDSIHRFVEQTQNNIYAAEGLMFFKLPERAHPYWFIAIRTPLVQEKESV